MIEIGIKQNHHLKECETNRLFFFLYLFRDEDEAIIITIDAHLCLMMIRLMDPTI